MKGRPGCRAPERGVAAASTRPLALHILVPWGTMSLLIKSSQTTLIDLLTPVYGTWKHRFYTNASPITGRQAAEVSVAPHFRQARSDSTPPEHVRFSLESFAFFFFFFICKATALVLQNYDIICKQAKIKCKFQTNSFKYENVLNEAMYPRVWLSLRPRPAESNTEDPRPSSRSVVGSAEGACWEPGLRGLWSALGYSSPGDPITSKLLQLPF